MASQQMEAGLFSQENKITIREEKDGENLTVYIGGYMTPVTVPELQKYLEEGTLDDVMHLVFDLSGLEYMSSFGLRVFLSTQKLMTRKGGYMGVRGVAPFAMELFDMTGFSNILTIEK